MERLKEDEPRGDKRRELNLGNYPEVSLETARGKFEDSRKKAKNGIDPILEKEVAVAEQLQAPTVHELIKEFIKRHAKPKTRNWQDTERMLNKQLDPSWGKRKVKDITKRDVSVLLDTIVDHGSPATSNQLLKLARKMFNFAIEQDILQTSSFRLGEMDEVIDAVLNHKKQGIIKVYNQNRYDREKQAALESWGRKLHAIIT